MADMLMFLTYLPVPRRGFRVGRVFKFAFQCEVREAHRGDLAGLLRRPAPRGLLAMTECDETVWLI